MQATNPTLQKGAIWYIASIAPFFLPAVSFESALFAILSPLPLFLLTAKNRLAVSLLALATNGALVYTMTANKHETLVALSLWSLIGILFPFFIRKSGRIKTSFLATLAITLALVFGTLVHFAREAGLEPVAYVKSEVSLGIDRMVTLPDSPIKQIVEEQGKETFQKQLVTELPSGVVIGLIITFWINLLFASRLVPGFLPEGFWSNYQNPEWLVWPTLACAALFSFTDHALYYIGLNGFKILILFYGFQGLSVLSHLLNRYKILGLGRALIFSLAVFVVMPIVLSLGFFDLWFDFRKKLSQQ